MHTFPALQLQFMLQHAIAITLFAGGNSILSQGKQLSSAQVPADSTTAAGVKPAGHTNPAEKNSQHMVAVDEDSLRHDAVTAEDAPITPFQPQPSQPQHSLYTSDSDSRSHCHPSPTTKSASKPTGSAMDRSDASQTAIRPSTLEAQFMKSSRGTSSELGSELSQQQPQLQPAVAKPESRPEAFSDQLDSQLSPPQSRPSSPESQTAEDTDNDSNDHAVTHVNGYFDKSDEDNISSSSMPDLSDQDTENEGKGEEEAGCVANGSRNRSHLRAAARSLEVNLLSGISMTRTSMYLCFLMLFLWIYHFFRPVVIVSLLSLFVCHTYPEFALRATASGNRSHGASLHTAQNLPCYRDLETRCQVNMKQIH